MRNALKGLCSVLVALVLCVALVTPSFAEHGGTHWYNWRSASFKKPTECSPDDKELLAEFGFGAMAVSEFKEKVYRVVDTGFLALLDLVFSCPSYDIFSLKDRDLLMARTLRIAVKRAASITWLSEKEKIAHPFSETAQQLEEQYLGIPGGL